MLHPSTLERLTASEGEYNDKMGATSIAVANFSTHTPIKTSLLDLLRLFVSHFIQVFNLGVARNKYPAGHRAFYDLETTSAAVPNIAADDEALSWATRLVEGDANRITAGGLPMGNPEIAEVTLARTNAMEAFTAQSTLKDAMDAAQEAVEDMNEDVDSLIKRVWDEVEAFYSEESAESKRANAREWGVVYVTEGASNSLTGLVKNAGGVVQEGAVVTIVESGAETETNSEGRYQFATVLTGDITIQAVLGALKGQVEVTIAEDAEGSTIEVGEIVVV